jgi:hypothetical protein
MDEKWDTEARIAGGYGEASSSFRCGMREHGATIYFGATQAARFTAAVPQGVALTVPTRARPVLEAYRWYLRDVHRMPEIRRL